MELRVELMRTRGPALEKSLDFQEASLAEILRVISCKVEREGHLSRRGNPR